MIVHITVWGINNATIQVPGPDKQDKFVNEVIFCQKNAENNF